MSPHHFGARLVNSIIESNNFKVHVDISFDEQLKAVLSHYKLTKEDINFISTARYRTQQPEGGVQ